MWVDLMNEMVEIVKLAGIGPEMLQRKTTKTFIDDCVNVVREGGDGGDHEDVDAAAFVRWGFSFVKHVRRQPFIVTGLT